MAGVKTSKQFIKSDLQCKIKKVFQMHIKYIYIPFYKSTRAHTHLHTDDRVENVFTQVNHHLPYITSSLHKLTGEVEGSRVQAFPHQ